MVQRRLKSEVWLRDVLNKQISVAENYAIFACVLLFSCLLLGHGIVSLFSQPDVHRTPLGAAPILSWLKAESRVSGFCFFARIKWRPPLTSPSGVSQSCGAAPILSWQKCGTQNIFSEYILKIHGKAVKKDEKRWKWLKTVKKDKKRWKKAKSAKSDEKRWNVAKIILGAAS